MESRVSDLLESLPAKPKTADSSDWLLLPCRLCDDISFPSFWLPLYSIQSTDPGILSIQNASECKRTASKLR